MNVADNLVKTPANKIINYWSPLSCLVEEQEDEDVELPITEQIFSVTTEESTQKSNNKIAEKWKRKIVNRHGILDTGCTSGAGAQQDIDCFNDTGEPSSKVFMLPNMTYDMGTSLPQLPNEPSRPSKTTSWHYSAEWTTGSHSHCGATSCAQQNSP